ncbi:MAG: molybdenum ABC transporter ATP-binding protein, partial [Candidatus Electrothrix sp. AR5]|nr:molybdenum ABC transporter ATP-binding protein [Candidatus Electrothrix sp. AR5]
ANLLHLDEMEDLGQLLRCRWGDIPIMLVKALDHRPGRFALNGRNIILFKKHPEASSARNILSCTVRKMYQTDWLVGVELECQGSRSNTLIAEIVPQSVDELDIRPGSEVVAVFKASAFRRLY